MEEICFERVIRKSDKVWFIETADGEEVWLPMSECDLDEHDNTVEVPEWLAIEKGLVRDAERTLVLDWKIRAVRR